MAERASPDSLRGPRRVLADRTGVVMDEEYEPTCDVKQGGYLQARISMVLK